MVVVFSPDGLELHSTPAAARIVRELHDMGVLQVIAGDVPRNELEDLAIALNFSGEILASPYPVAAARSVSSLPPECYWWVTAREHEALEAADAGFNVLFCALHDAPSRAVAERCAAVIDALDDMLPIIRVPYMHEVLAARQLLSDLGHHIPRIDT